MGNTEKLCVKNTGGKSAMGVFGLIVLGLWGFVLGVLLTVFVGQLLQGSD